MIPLIYHPVYNITAFGIERLHPFDSRKYARIRNALIGRGLRRASDFVRPKPVRFDELLRFHTPEYLKSLRSPRTVAAILEIPIVARLPRWLIDWRILRPMRYATGGTMVACRLALEHGIAINLGGGYHHAASDRGGGFCVYADIPLALAALHAEQRIQRALVIDLDAPPRQRRRGHLPEMGLGRDPRSFSERYFPDPQGNRRFSAAGSRGPDGHRIYGRCLRGGSAGIDAVRPDLVIYNAGSDPFKGDTLANLRLSRDELADRDLDVATEVRERRIPLAMVLSGGYSAESWRIHADAIEGILTRFERVGEDRK